MDVKKRKSCILYAVGTIALAALDQLAKYLAASRLKGNQPVVLIEDVFQLRYLENQGAGFGLLQGKWLWFVIVTAILLAFMAAVYFRMPMEKKYRWLRMVITVLTAGAIGNLIDRLRYNYVIDFFYFEWIDFPIFNVADIYVSCGVAALMLLILFYYKDAELEALWPFRKKKP